jgi:O-antigen biosynthesis protein
LFQRLYRWAARVRALRWLSRHWPFRMARGWISRAAGLDSLTVETVRDPCQFLPNVKQDGLSVVQIRAIGFSGEPGVFTFLDRDPQVLFETQMQGHSDAWLCLCTFDVESLDGGLAAPRVYLDYSGQGFSQDASFVLVRQPDGLYRALVAFPSLQPTVRWDPSERSGQVRLNSIKVEPYSLEALGHEAAASVHAVLEVETGLPPGPRERHAWAERALALSLELNQNHLNFADYNRWTKIVETPNAADYDRMKTIIGAFPWHPKFSFVTPTYNTPPALLEACIRSLLDQVYPHFEICVADDCSTNPEVRNTLTRLAAAHSQLKISFRSKNGHISEASNTALELATGDFIVLVDHDDIVPDYTLLVVADYLNRNPNAKILYSDEDKLDPSGRRCEPYFKSDFNRFLMFGHNMVSHLGVYDRSLVASVGGFRKGYEGSQDYDLFLRCMQRCAEQDIVHIPHILYHWRKLPGSTAISSDQKSYAIIAAQRAISDFLSRQGLPYTAADGIAPGLTALAVVGDPPRTKVSIIIPTRDRLDLLVPCIESLRPHIDDAAEVIVVDNGSNEPETSVYLRWLVESPGFSVISSPGDFNFSAICNLGVAASTGDIICLLNNDTELVSQDWLIRARALLATPDVAVVGARLLYPDQSVQHFGLYLGMGAHGVAGTPHRGWHKDHFGPFGKARLVQEFSAVTAACMFVKRAVYEDVGGFDPALQVAYNDVDFCLRVRQSGYKVICDPDIVLIHKESKTRGADTDGARAQRLEAEAATMRDRWGPVLANDPYYNPNLTLERDDFSLADIPRVAFPWRR